MDFDTILRIGLIILGIGSIIFVHEMGHFLVAKLVGVRVDGFSLGFPPTGVGFRRTETGLKTTVLPNFLSFTPLEVGGIEKGSPADEIGLSLGDRILAVNDRPTERLDFLGLEGLLRDEWSSGRTVSFLVEREDERLTVGPLEMPPSSDLKGLGLYPNLAAQKKVIASGEAWAFGLDPSERITSVGNKAMPGREDFRRFASEAISRGTGILKLHILAPPAAGEESGSERTVVLLIQNPDSKPSCVYTLPLLKGSEGQTEYRLSLIPIGGYVKMAGDTPGEGQGAPDEFLQKPVGARAAIIAAGAAMNILFSLVVFVLAFQVGVRFYAPLVGGVRDGSAAQKAGLRVGDRVLRINDTAVTGFIDIPSEIAFSDPEEGSLFEIERMEDGVKVRKSIRVFPTKNEEAGRLEVGIEPMASSTVDAIEKGSPLYEAGLRAGDNVVAFGDRAVTDKTSLLRSFHAEAAAGRDSITLRVKREDRLLDPFTVPIPGKVKRVWRVGITPRMLFRVSAAGPLASPLEEGDEIFAVNGKHVAPADLFAFLKKVLGPTLDGEVAFHITGRDEEIVRRRAFLGEKDFRAFHKALTVACVVRVESMSDKSDFPRVGGTKGAVIVALGGKSFSDLAGMQKLIQDSDGKDLAVRWIAPEGTEKTGRIRPMGQWNTDLRALGIVKLSHVKIDVKLSFTDALSVGLKKSVKFAGDVFKMLRGIFTARLSPKNLGGPVLIVKASYHFAEDGLGKLLFFLGILGINLGIINLFPIPILDGGHLVFLAIEKIKGSPVSEPVQVVAQYAGLLVLLLLMIYVTMQDIIKLAK
jgi:regulator of sigma E protease